MIDALITLDALLCALNYPSQIYKFKYDNVLSILSLRASFASRLRSRLESKSWTLILKICNLLSETDSRQVRFSSFLVNVIAGES